MEVCSICPFWSHVKSISKSVFQRLKSVSRLLPSLAASHPCFHHIPPWTGSSMSRTQLPGLGNGGNPGTSTLHPHPPPVAPGQVPHLIENPPPSDKPLYASWPRQNHRTTFTSVLHTAACGRGSSPPSAALRSSPRPLICSCFMDSSSAETSASLHRVVWSTPGGQEATNTK